MRVIEKLARGPSRRGCNTRWQGFFARKKIFSQQHWYLAYRNEFLALPSESYASPSISLSLGVMVLLTSSSWLSETRTFQRPPGKER